MTMVGLTSLIQDLLGWSADDGDDGDDDDVAVRWLIFSRGSERWLWINRMLRGCASRKLRKSCYKISRVLRMRAVVRRTESHCHKEESMPRNQVGRLGLCAVARHKSSHAGSFGSWFLCNVHVQDVELWARWAPAKFTAP